MIKPAPLQRNPLMKAKVFKTKLSEHTKMKEALPVKGILFDLDGTILDTTQAYLEAAKLTFQTMGQQIPEYTQMLEIPKRIEKRLPIGDLTKIDPKKFREAYVKNFYRVAASKTKPVPQVAETLELLSRKVQLAVITMRFMPKENVNAELQRHDLARYFTSIITALDTIKPKPRLRRLLKLLWLWMFKCGDSRHRRRLGD
jgi:beta-phosphoglucomutase-like phosphatase (HAD superfamily)